MQQQKVTNTTSAMMTYCGFNSHSVSWDVFFIFSCSSKLPSSVLSNIFIITFADRQRNQILLKFLLITGFCKKGHRCSCADAPKYQSAVLPSVIIDREFDTLKSKKVPQSLEIGLFFCQIFIFII